MHIAVDGSFWGGEERGVAVATRRLWTAYLARARSGRTTVFAPASHRAHMTPASFVPVGPLAGLRRVRWQQFVLPRALRRLDVDLLHAPCYTAPLAAHCRWIVTMHDVIGWTHPQLAGWRNALHLRLLAGRGLRRAAAICVPTDCVRQAVLARFDVRAQDVFVVPWGTDDEIVPMPKDDARREVRRLYGVDEPFALFCGCIEAKKNLDAAVRAAEQAGVLLLIAGPSIASSSRRLNALSPGRWRYLGHVPASALGALYSAASALLFPSFVEGFGLPAIEAMRCGCPVIASDDPALREVCEGAALHVPPHDPPSFAASLRAVLAGRGLRDELIGRGLERASHFTWSTAVDRFEDAVRHAGAR